MNEQAGERMEGEPPIQQPQDGLLPRARKAAAHVATRYVDPASEAEAVAQDMAQYVLALCIRAGRDEEALRISYPATPVDCLLSTLSELVWTFPGDDPTAVRDHVLRAVDEARAALTQQDALRPPKSSVSEVGGGEG